MKPKQRINKHIHGESKGELVKSARPMEDVISFATSLVLLANQGSTNNALNQESNVFRETVS